MDDQWSQERRNRDDAHARRLWQDMEQRVWRDAKIFSGLEPSPPKPDTTDNIDVLTDEELNDIGDLGEPDELRDADSKLPTPLAKRVFRHFRRGIS